MSSLQTMLQVSDCAGIIKLLFSTFRDTVSHLSFVSMSSDKSICMGVLHTHTHKHTCTHTHAHTHTHTHTHTQSLTQSHTPYGHILQTETLAINTTNLITFFDSSRRCRVSLQQVNFSLRGRYLNYVSQREHI